MLIGRKCAASNTRSTNSLTPILTIVYRFIHHLYDTDLMVYCRRGYNDASMNTTNWVWNASLSKAFGKREQWVIKANGFDLLHQISTVRRTVNAQGRTETWYNTIPSYATLHIVYRLDIKSKKK